MSSAFQPKENLKDVRQVRFCKRCLMPDSRPRIFFDEDGVCNACLNADEKKTIDWKSRHDEFLRLVEPYRSKNGEWDCVVPWSGGKDSSSIAYRLKFELGLNPLLVTFSPMIPNAVGQHNCEQMVRAGFDHIMFRPNQNVHRILAKRFFIERGNPKVAWDAGVNVIPVKEALNNKIRLVFYAEHGESEYGGRVLNEESRRLRDFTEVIEHQIGDDPRNWVMDGVIEADLNPYTYPSVEDLNDVGIKALYFAYYFKWSMYENFQYLKDKIDFKRHPIGRTPGTFTNFDSLDDKMDDLYYYMQFIKFGFGRTVRDTSRFIQNNHMTREEAIAFAQKFDGEFPDQNLDEVLEYLNLTKDEFYVIVDKHRNEEIWKKENGQWKLRFPVR